MTLGYFLDIIRPLQKHSKLSKSLGVNNLKMYCAIGASLSSLHTESIDSLIKHNYDKTPPTSCSSLCSYQKKDCNINRISAAVIRLSPATCIDHMLTT